MPTLGLVANIYNEANALPGWLECHLPIFDDVRVYHAGPGGEMSTDGTMEILEKWKVPYLIGSIDDGFGATRTRAVRSSPCDYVMILDCDERFHSVLPVLVCEGEATPQPEVDAILNRYDFSDLHTRQPDWDSLEQLGSGLRVIAGEPFDHIGLLRHVIENGEYDAVTAVRRHWHGLGFKRPTQNWYKDPDWQMRVLRNCDDIGFDPTTKMHERLVGAKSFYRADVQGGPFFDHYHFWFKKMEVFQRSHDVSIYNAINSGHRPPTWEEFCVRT